MICLNWQTQTQRVGLRDLSGRTLTVVHHLLISSTISATDRTFWIADNPLSRCDRTYRAMSCSVTAAALALATVNAASSAFNGPANVGHSISRAMSPFSGDCVGSVVMAME